MNGLKKLTSDGALRSDLCCGVAKRMPPEQNKTVSVDDSVLLSELSEKSSRTVNEQVTRHQNVLLLTHSTLLGILNQITRCA
jgi:hypothetical protein